MRFRCGDFSPGTMGNFQPELTIVPIAHLQCPFPNSIGDAYLFSGRR